MALISSGIENVRVFELPCGTWSDGEYISTPRTALVKWRSSWSDKLYQIYVNGQHAGATFDTEQRQMVVQVPTSPEAAVRIEVFAVEPEQIETDFSSEIDSAGLGEGRVKISFLRGQNLPIDSAVQIYFDNGTGQIDYDNPLNERLIRVWPNWQDKAGFGMSRFGFSDFGYDCSAAVGFGNGTYGQGQFGLDVDMFEWVSEPLETGIYKFSVKITDENGNEGIGSESGDVVVIPAARPAEQVSVYSFDKDTNELVLSVS